MKEIEISYRAEFILPPTDARMFSQFFPSGTIEDISLQQVPEKALAYFESKSRNYRHPETYIPKNFDRVWLILHDNGDRTYAVHQIKKYSHVDDTESLVYLVDIRGRRKIGHGELRYCLTNSSPYFKDKPFVGYTETTRRRQREGLGTRRLFLMNAFAQMLYQKPLHSDTLIGIRAKMVWEKLVKQGHALKYLEGKQDRFVITAYPTSNSSMS